MLSPRFIWRSWALSVRENPPSSYMATEKDTDVRVDGFWKIMPRVFPWRSLARRRSALSCRAVSRTLAISPSVRSVMESRSFFTSFASPSESVVPDRRLPPERLHPHGELQRVLQKIILGVVDEGLGQVHHEAVHGLVHQQDGPDQVVAVLPVLVHEQGDDDLLVAVGRPH